MQGILAAAAFALLVAACGQNEKSPVGIAPVPTSPEFGLTDPSNGDGVCMGDDAFAFGQTSGMASATDVNCTAEDIEIAQAVVSAYSFDNVTFTPLLPGQRIQCDPATQPIVFIETVANLQNNAQERYDIGVWIESDPNNPVVQFTAGSSTAVTGACTHYNLTNGSTGVSNLDGDACGDMSQGSGLATLDLDVLEVPCQDDDGDGVVEIGACIAWQNVIGPAVRVCPDPGNATSYRHGTTPNNKAKCNCDPMVLPIDLVNPAVEIDKTGDALSKIGDDVTYSFTITNTGDVALTLTSVVDDKLGNLTAAATTAGCATLAVNASCNFTVNHTVPAGAPDPYVNTVTATYGSTGANATDTDNHSTNLFQPSVEVVKTGPATAAVGQSITYSFTITNTGSADSPNLILDSVNDNVLGDLSDEAPAACDALAPGASCNFTASRTVLAGDPDPLVNTVTVHYHPNGFPNDISDTDDHTVDIVSSAVVIDKTGDALSKIGDEVTYSFTITNTNGVAITLTSVVDDKLGNLTATATAANCATLAPNASCNFTVNHTIPAGAPDPYVNTVTATYTFTTGGGSVTVTDSDSHSTNLFQPSVQVAKTSATTLAVVGQNVTYTFTVTNTSSADSPNLILDTFIDNVLGDLSDDAPAACDALAPGASCTFNVTRAVQAGDPDPLVNTVTVHYHPQGFPNDISDGDDHSVDIAHPNFTVAKACTSTQPVPLGVATQWSITVQNTGDVTISLLVTDLQINLGGGAGVQVSLAPGATQTFTGSGATANTPGATVSNTATAVGTVAGTTFNQTKTSTATCTYAVPPGATLLIIDEDGIDNGLHFNANGGLIVPSGPHFFSDLGVNDDKPSHTQRDVLRYFAQNPDRIITVRTGQTGDEGWFAPNCIPQKWISGGSNACLPSGADRTTAMTRFWSGPVPAQSKLDKIPAVMPLRALGLNALVGQNVCAVVYDSDISINYNSNSFPFTDGNLQGETLGIVAFKVLETITLDGFSSSTLPQVRIQILSTSICSSFQLFNAPVPASSSVPNDRVAPGSPSGYRALKTWVNLPLFF